MKRLLAALLLVASPVLAQATNGWAEIANGWGEIQNPPGYDTIPAPTGCATTELAYFLGSPATLTCLDNVYWTAVTKSLDVTDGRVQAANLKAIGLATPGGITVVPTLSQIGAITAVAGSALADGDALSVGDGTGVVPMEFDAAPGDGTTGGAIPIIFDGTETATEIRDAVKTILDAAGRDWTTSAQGADGIGIVRATPGATGGAVTEAVGAAGFLVTDWTDPTHATTVTYQLVACLADGSCTEPGPDSTTGTSTATLSATNYNALSWVAVSGAASYKVYRKVAPTSPATVGVIYAGTALAVSDTGLVGDTTTAGVDETGLLRGDGLRIGTSAVAGHVLTADANGYYTPQAGGGGVTNSAGANVLAKSDGTNLVASSVTDDGAGNVTWGTASGTPTAFIHQLSGAGSGTNVAGSEAKLGSGPGTGNAVGSKLSLGGPVAGASGSGAQTLAYPVAVRGEVLADGTGPALGVTVALPASPSAAVAGVNVAVTGAGSAAQDQTGASVTLNAGYTGAKAARGLSVANASAAGSTYNTSSDAILGYSSSTGALAQVVHGWANGAATVAAGVSGRAMAGTTRVGVFGAANTTTNAAGGYFVLSSTGTDTPSSGKVAALYASNTDTTAQILRLDDSTTQVFSVNDGGGTDLMREVEANTAGSGAPNVLTATESFKVLTNEGATAANYHTLPTAAKGLTYTFVVQDGDGIRITAGADDTIRVAATVTAAAGYITSSTIGDTVTLVAINAVEWVATSALGTWTAGP